MPLQEKAETADKLNTDLASAREELSKRSREIQVSGLNIKMYLSLSPHPLSLLSLSFFLSFSKVRR